MNHFLQTACVSYCILPSTNSHLCAHIISVCLAEMIHDCTFIRPAKSICCFSISVWTRLLYYQPFTPPAVTILDIEKVPTSLTVCTVFLFSSVHLPQGLLVPSIPHHICSSLGLQHKCPSETLSAEGGRLQVRCAIQEKLANQGEQTQGLTNHTTEGEGRGLLWVQSGIRALLSAE